ncbi:MAG TPA: undecaprenyl-diphosphate phosphatase [Deltaproteobacteria bacterium]|jgi:undecaprenyl-diphosphatase|nr:undecaprenyl-diphosphate phosphatase [Deltaproteobacteria bacterium]
MVLGLVEGITEYLPVSSTGHLILASSLLGLGRDEASKSALDAFEVVVQGGAILAVLGLYATRVRSLLLGLAGRDPAGLKLARNLFLAFLPAAVLGLAVHEAIKTHLFNPPAVFSALFVGGVWMIWLDRHRRHEGRGVNDLSARDALWIGLLQCASLWPGTSRSMMTIGAGLLIGMRATEAAEFSFLLGLPTLGAACLYELAKNVHEASQHGTPNLFQELGVKACLLGVVVATVSAAFAVRWLVSFLNRHGLAPFGWYRIALCIVMGLLIFAGWVEIVT